MSRPVVSRVLNWHFLRVAFAGALSSISAQCQTAPVLPQSARTATKPPITAQEQFIAYWTTDNRDDGFTRLGKKTTPTM